MIIPIPFSRRKELLAAFPEMGRREWRWALEIRWLGIALQKELRASKMIPSWRVASRHVGIALTRHWHLGSHHVWHDGPNCSFSLGFLHFSWSGYDCKRCSDMC